MIGVVEVLVEVLINSSSECFQVWTVELLIKSGGRSFHSLAVLGKNECLCASILEYIHCLEVCFRGRMSFDRPHA